MKTTTPREIAAKTELPSWANESQFIDMLEYAVAIGSLDLAGGCREVSHQMAGLFPHLQLIWGWVNCDRHAQWPHWYLRARDGTIYDPTRSQFETISGYGEWSGIIPDGRCRFCLALIYHGEMCSTEWCCGP